MAEMTLETLNDSEQGVLTPNLSHSHLSRPANSNLGLPQAPQPKTKLAPSNQTLEAAAVLTTHHKLPQAARATLPKPPVAIKRCSCATIRAGARTQSRTISNSPPLHRPRNRVEVEVEEVEIRGERVRISSRPRLGRYPSSHLATTPEVAITSPLHAAVLAVPTIWAILTTAAVVATQGREVVPATDTTTAGALPSSHSLQAAELEVGEAWIRTIGAMTEMGGRREVQATTAASVMSTTTSSR